MRYTKKVNMKLPEYSDTIDIEELNGNFEITDGHIGQAVTSMEGVHGFRWNEAEKKIGAYDEATANWVDTPVAALDQSGKVKAEQMPEMDYIPNAQKAAANGVATLDGGGKVKAEQLPEMDYIPNAEKGAVNGVATLGADGLLPAKQLPPIETLPRGMICMWSGANNKIPTGWLLCDGTNGTPDLRGRFIIGAGGSYAVGEKGGSEKVTLSVNEMPAHTHTFSGTANSAGAHTHTVSGSTKSAGAHTHTVTISTSEASGGGASITKRNFWDTSMTYTTSSAGAHTHAISVSAASSGAHTHTVTGTNASTGGGQSHENRPPYYALCFIMKN